MLYAKGGITESKASCYRMCFSAAQATEIHTKLPVHVLT